MWTAHQFQRSAFAQELDFSNTLLQHFQSVPGKAEDVWSPGHSSSAY